MLRTTLQATINKIISNNRNIKYSPKDTLSIGNKLVDTEKIRSIILKIELEPPITAIDG